ncbi:MAG: hypothetical protein HQK96_14345 [Nitrospirae bacterium]|nr:hypothetical protein [Nitrospirota bacterium]
MSKNKWFNLRVTEDEKDRIVELAKTYKMTHSKFIITQALDKVVRVNRVAVLEQSTKFLLKNLANNMNQIAIELHRQEQEKSVFDRFNYRENIEKLNDVIDKINKIFK